MLRNVLIENCAGHFGPIAFVYWSMLEPAAHVGFELAVGCCEAGKHKLSLGLRIGGGQRSALGSVSRRASISSRATLVSICTQIEFEQDRAARGWLSTRPRAPVSDIFIMPQAQPDKTSLRMPSAPLVCVHVCACAVQCAGTDVNRRVPTSSRSRRKVVIVVEEECGAARSIK
eukprot:3614274-Prymnesium_polylepis.2